MATPELHVFLFISHFRPGPGSKSAQCQALHSPHQAGNLTSVGMTAGQTPVLGQRDQGYFLKLGTPEIAKSGPGLATFLVE